MARTMTPRAWYFAVTTVVLLIAVAVVALVVHGGRTPAPGPAAVGSSSPASTSPGRTSRPPTPTPARRTTHPTPPPHSATPPRPTTPPHPTTSPRPPTPPRLTANMLGIPSQQVVAPIDVCQIVAGGLQPPADIRRTCYWAGGARVSARAGTTVIVGQCNWAGQWGALGRIGSLRPGDTLLTSGAHGRVTEWRVGAVSYRPKSQGILPAAFVGGSGPRRLYLITGGGRYDAQRQSYLDNIYVLATPAAG